MNKAHNGVPKAVTRTDELHSGGIFSLVNSPRNHADQSRLRSAQTIVGPQHLMGSKIVTAGKDARSVLSTLRPEGGAISVVRRFEDHRSSVVKCARFRPTVRPNSRACGLRFAGSKYRSGCKPIGCWSTGRRR